MIVTVNLAKGAMAMSKKKVIVKRLNSIQNFGAIDILCTDKTGTLTQDRVILEKAVDVTNRDSDDVLRYAYLNSYYQTGLRNLLDRSVLSHTELDVERGCNFITAEVVRWIIRAVDQNEYKRRQAAPGLKITSKAFGSGRRMPIAAHYQI